MIKERTATPYPGTPLEEGSSGCSVLYMQQQLNICAIRYTAIITLTTDSKFGSDTKDATMLFQKQFSLSVDGIIGEQTWNKIVEAATAVETNTAFPVSTEYPGIVIEEGSQGDSVRFIQSYLTTVMDTPQIKIDGIYGSNTVTLVSLFQSAYGLTVDGKVGPNTWSKMIVEFNAKF